MRVPLVYLDQNAAIYLARAHTGHPAGNRFRDASQSAIRASRDGTAGFPLSTYHYQETVKQSDLDARARLGSFIYKLSRGLRISPLHRVTARELNFALYALFGDPPQAPPLNLFGRNVAHAFRECEPDEPDWAPPTDVPLEVRRRMQIFYHETLEQSALGAISILPLPRLPPDPAERWATAQRELSSNLKAWISQTGPGQFHRKDKIRRMALATEIWELATNNGLATRLSAMGMNLEHFLQNAVRRSEALLRYMPATDLAYRLRCIVHENPQHAWEANDLNDLAALSVAATYCDVVVTENRWWHYLTRARRHVRATVLRASSDMPRALPELLRIGSGASIVTS